MKIENKEEKFKAEVSNNILNLSRDINLHSLSISWVERSAKHKWAYNFTWFGRPAIQFPNDAWGMQELIWQIKPDLIIETGIAHGGSLVFSASMLALLDYCDAVQQGMPLDIASPKRRVLGLDIDIRAHNRSAIEAHPMANRIDMIEGSSIDPAIIALVQDIACGYERVLVVSIQPHLRKCAR